MRRAILFLTTIALLCLAEPVFSQNNVVELIEEYGKFDRWCVRSVNESGIIGGRTKLLYEFYGDMDTVSTREPYVSPDYYLWRTNNVLAVVAGVVKTNNTVFPEKRGNGYCARIETHIEEVKALGIINMEVVCQGVMMIGTLPEPITDTKNPMAKVIYGIPFEGKPSALVFDYKAEVGHETVRGTGFSRLKYMGTPDYPIANIILQKRWEDEDGTMHAKRIGTGIEMFRSNVDDWVNGHRLEIIYGDATLSPRYEDCMDLVSDPDKAFYAINSKGRKVMVKEEGWGSVDEEPNYLIVSFLASSGSAFYGGVGNKFWIDNVKLEM
ncbi:MAG: PCMD domain-containing protein [Candidatus Cryptobacteroides sp.]